MPVLPARARPWLAVAAAVLIAGVLLPPAEGYARQYAFAQSLQFVIFAVAGPALLVSSAPRRTRAASRRSGTGPARLTRLAARRVLSCQPSYRVAVRLALFITLVIIWRLPAAVNALARDPGLVAAEMVTLLVAGSGVWLELAAPPPASTRLPRPQRAAVAALAMWAIWALAYITGMSRASWFAAYDHGAAGGLGAAADQQLAVAIMWAVPALCFLPVIYAMVMSWLGDSTDQGGGPRTAAPGEGPRGLPRPLRGWRSPQA